MLLLPSIQCLLTEVLKVISRVVAFAALLHLRVSQGQFNYHLRCKELGLCHLAFADDLFILCGATTEFFALINDLLNDFHSYSGLRSNMGKSSVFFAGFR